MKVYIVLNSGNHDYGASVAGVFATLEMALDYLDGPDGENCYLDDAGGRVVNVPETELMWGELQR